MTTLAYLRAAKGAFYIAGIGIAYSRNGKIFKSGKRISHAFIVCFFVNLALIRNRAISCYYREIHLRD